MNDGKDIELIHTIFFRKLLCVNKSTNLVGSISPPCLYLITGGYFGLAAGTIYQSSMFLFNYRWILWFGRCNPLSVLRVFVLDSQIELEERS